MNGNGWISDQTCVWEKCLGCVQLDVLPKSEPRAGVTHPFIMWGSGRHWPSMAGVGRPSVTRVDANGAPGGGHLHTNLRMAGNWSSQGWRVSHYGNCPPVQKGYRVNFIICGGNRWPAVRSPGQKGGAGINATTHIPWESPLVRHLCQCKMPA